jgi:hypothetical protein
MTRSVCGVKRKIVQMQERVAETESTFAHHPLRVAARARLGVQFNAAAAVAG